MIGRHNIGEEVIISPMIKLEDMVKQPNKDILFGKIVGITKHQPKTFWNSYVDVKYWEDVYDILGNNGKKYYANDNHIEPDFNDRLGNCYIYSKEEFLEEAERQIGFIEYDINLLDEKINDIKKAKDKVNETEKKNRLKNR